MKIIISESQYKILSEVRVPRKDRIELYRDNNIVIVVPLTHEALKKYATKCQWCINDDKTMFEDFHAGKSILIIQRQFKPRISKTIPNYTTGQEIFTYAKYLDGEWDINMVKNVTGISWIDEKEIENTWYDLTEDINNFIKHLIN